MQEMRPHMSAQIILELARLAQIAPQQPALERKAYIQQQKQAIYAFRNQRLSAYLNAPICSDDFARTAYGKPFLPAYPQLALNHSHSRQHYALAYSEQLQDVGVDVEDLDRKVRFESLARHMFHPAEWELWQAYDQETDYWFKVWTTKEAVLKASGLGIRMSLNQLNSGVHPHQQGGFCHHEGLGTFAYQHLKIGGCMLTVAWRSERSCKGFQFPKLQLIRH